MIHITIPINAPQSRAYLESSPRQRLLWLQLLMYCCGEENGGRIAQAASWTSSEWTTHTGITIINTDDIQCALMRYVSGDVHIEFYPVKEQRRSEKNRAKTRRYKLALATSTQDTTAADTSTRNKTDTSILSKDTRIIQSDTGTRNKTDTSILSKDTRITQSDTSTRNKTDTSILSKDTRITQSDTSTRGKDTRIDGKKPSDRLPGPSTPEILAHQKGLVDAVFQNSPATTENQSQEGAAIIERLDKQLEHVPDDELVVGGEFSDTYIKNLLLDIATEETNKQADKILRANSPGLS